MKRIRLADKTIVMAEVDKANRNDLLSIACHERELKIVQGKVIAIMTTYRNRKAA